MSYTVDQWEEEFAEKCEPHIQDATTRLFFKRIIARWRSECRAEGVKEERERIRKAMEPAFNDFRKAGQHMTETVVLKETGAEILENLGYMKSVLLDSLEDSTKEKV